VIIHGTYLKILVFIVSLGTFVVHLSHDCFIPGDEDEVKERETKQEYNLLCDWIKQQLGDKVAKVQVSKRLSSSPCVLVSGKFGWSANMERSVVGFCC
jgi:heat shock protein beta